MIVIELRIGRTPVAPSRAEAAAAEPAPQAMRAIQMPGGSGRRWRFGNGTVGAILATVFAGVALGFVPAGDTPHAQALRAGSTASAASTTSVGIPLNPWSAPSGPAAVGQWDRATPSFDERAPEAAAASSPVWDVQFVRLVDDATRGAMQQVQRRIESGRPYGSDAVSNAADPQSATTVPRADSAGWPAWYQAEQNAAARTDTRLLSAIARDVSVRRTAATSSTSNSPQFANTLTTARSTQRDAELGAATTVEQALPAPTPTPTATPTRAPAPDAAAMAELELEDEPRPEAPAAPQFSITRDQSAEAQWLLQALRERAATGDWSGVQSLRAKFGPADGFSGSLALAKWDARIALALGDPAHALSVLAPHATALDDEGARLQAVSLLRTGDASAAVGAYRALLAAHPDDAQLWLGLGVALEASAAHSEAVRFAYGQSLQLAEDAALRQSAQAHLDAHRA